MSSRPWMPLYVNDFMADTGDLEPTQIGVYLLLLMIAWRREDGAIPGDMKWLRRALRCCCDIEGRQFNRCVPTILARYFKLGSDGKFYNKRLTQEREKSLKMSITGAQNAHKRWSGTNEIKELRGRNPMLFTVTKNSLPKSTWNPEGEKKRLVEEGRKTDYDRLMAKGLGRD